MMAGVYLRHEDALTAGVRFMLCGAEDSPRRDKRFFAATDDGRERVPDGQLRVADAI